MTPHLIMVVVGMVLTRICQLGLVNLDSVHEFITNTLQVALSATTTWRLMGEYGLHMRVVNHRSPTHYITSDKIPKRTSVFKLLS